MVVLNMPHIWTEEEKQFLRDNVQGTPIHDLTKLFNEHFDSDMTYTQIRATTKRLKLKCGQQDLRRSAP